MAPHDHSLRGWAGGAYRPVGGPRVWRPRSGAASESRGRDRSRAGAARRDPCHASSAPMLHVLLLLLATGPCPKADSAGRRDSVARLTSRVQLRRGFLPVLWSNDYGGVTVGLRARPMCRDDVERGLFVASAAMRGGATSSINVYGRWSNPPFLGRGLPPGATSVAAWPIDGGRGALGLPAGTRRSPGSRARRACGHGCAARPRSARGCSRARTWVRPTRYGSYALQSRERAGTGPSLTRSCAAAERCWCDR